MKVDGEKEYHERGIDKRRYVLEIARHNSPNQHF
jgi:hypothetical protein